jgi:soluble lytic murein transglycosylase-like protein
VSDQTFRQLLRDRRVRAIAAVAVLGAVIAVYLVIDRAGWQQERAELQDRIAQFQETTEGLRADLGRLRDIHRSIERARDTRAELEDAVAARQNKLDQLRDEVGQAEQRLSKVRKSISAYEEHLASLRQEVSARRDQLETLRASVATNRSTLQDVRQAVAQAEARRDELQAEHESLQEGTASAREELGRLERSISAHEERLESLRQEYANNALLSYQLALYFRDLGLYRSSILAATSLLSLSGQTVFDAPHFIGRLSYPVYYADLILPLADQYGYDPLLQFSLVRQESLFESFARSGAAAQGLSQVIPDTGTYIAQQLGWPDFENEDLYKPHVGLAFGAFYLNQQLQAFDGHAYAALAAYNAGPGNAARWYEEAGDDHDMFLEVVTFSETRQYIERIYTGHVIYRFLYSE